MLVRTQDLIGPALDWAVARCVQMLDNVYISAGMILFKPSYEHAPPSGIWEPSTDCSQSYPIIEREGIATHRNSKRVYRDEEKRWQADLIIAPDEPPPRRGYGPYRGPTPLIAAMRCYVASKLGDDVEVPDELAKE